MDLSHQHLLQNKKTSLSILYHDIFDYPLTKEELHRWQLSATLNTTKLGKWVKIDKYFVLKGREHLVHKRETRAKISEGKLQIAKKAAEVLARIPTIKLVGITGSLAMKNSRDESDIDFLIITTGGVMWSTRLLSYLVCRKSGIAVRKPKDKNEKDMLCLNMWLDERDLYFDKQNLFTAHELAQIIPLVNKNKTYEKLILTNKWIFNYWSNAIGLPKTKLSKDRNTKRQSLIFLLIEHLAYWFQLKYMKSKKSREVASPTRAFFHPFDWGEKVIRELEKRQARLPLDK